MPAVVVRSRVTLRPSPDMTSSSCIQKGRIVVPELPSDVDKVVLLRVKLTPVEKHAACIITTLSQSITRSCMPLQLVDWTTQ